MDSLWIYHKEMSLRSYRLRLRVGDNFLNMKHQSLDIGEISVSRERNVSVDDTFVDIWLISIPLIY